MEARFTGKTVIVTGAAKGIGKATALRFLREGGEVAVLDLEPHDSEWVVKLLAESEGLGGRLQYIQADCTDEDTVAAAVDEVKAAFGKIDILINNAGFGSNIVPLDEMSLEFWQKFQSINLLTCFLVSRAALPSIRATGGSIVNVSSIVGRTISEVANIAYHAAKSGMLGFTRSLAQEEGPNGVRVNAVAPGTTFTERVEKRYGELGTERRDKLIASYPLRRPAGPNELAGPILFLASEDASYITGAVLDVNGGRFMA